MRERGWIFLAVLAVAVAASPVQAAADKAAIDKAAKALRTIAEDYFDGNMVGEDELDTGTDLKYDAGSVPALIAAVNTPGKPQVMAFVANRLGQGLIDADKDVVTKVLPTLERISLRMRNFLVFPRLSRGAIAQLQLPPYNPRAPEAIVLRQMRVIEERRLQKQKRDLAVLRYNRETVRIRRLVYRLTARYGSDSDAVKVAQIIIAAERGGRGTYRDYLDAIGKDASSLSKDRAKLLYDQFRPVGEALKWKKGKYTRPNEAKIPKADQSEFDSFGGKPGINFLDAVNRLARTAGAPNVSVPSSKDVDEYHKKNKGK